MLARYGVVWLEEALPPDDIEGYRELRRGARLFISTGEVLTRRQSFRPWLETGAVDIIQPDVTKVGGGGLSSDVEHCIIARAHSASFDAPGGLGSTVQLPLTFVQRFP